MQHLLLALAGLDLRGNVARHTIARQAEIANGPDHLVRVEQGIGIGLILFAKGKFDRTWHTDREVRTRAIGKFQIRAPAGRIVEGVVGLDKAARAPHQVMAHQFAPIVRVGTLLKGSQRAHRALVLRVKSRFTQLAEQFLGADAQVFALLVAQEEPQLSRDVEEGLIIRSRGQQHAFALVFFDVLLDDFVTLALAVAQIVALVHDHQTVAPQARQFIENIAQRADAPDDAVFLQIRIPHFDQVFWTDDQGFQVVVILHNAREGCCHQRLA